MKTMKFAVIAVGLVGLMSMTSCSKMYYQVVQTKATNPAVVMNDNDDSGYYYEDKNCKIAYDFWCKDGDAGFTVYNKTDEVMYVDMTKSFYIRNGASSELFEGRTWVETVAVANNISANSATTRYEEQPVVAIAPHSYKTMGSVKIDQFLILDCDLERKPLKNKPATMAYTEESTPLEFGNYITYRVGDKGAEKIVKTMFYISRVTNYLNTDLQRSEYRKNCKNGSNYESQMVNIMRFAPTTGFYHVYSK